MDTRKIRVASRKKKPVVGMEVTLTISMKADHTLGQSADAIVEAFKAATELSALTNAAWVKVHCSGVPAALEHLLASAMEKSQAELDALGAPQLKLVVDNTKPA